MIKGKPFFLILCLCCITSLLSNVHASQKGIKTSIKRYTVFTYKDSNVICEPYVVKKDDWLYKIFRKKGEISEKDFPHFLDIFKELNENISNIDAIEPGQHIMIPLKKGGSEYFHQSHPGIVDIPVIEYATMADSGKIEPFLKKYKVEEGDTVSTLLNKHFLNKDGSITKEGIQAFKIANPQIKNIDLIYKDSYIHLPDPSITSQPWFGSFFKGFESAQTNPVDVENISENNLTIKNQIISDQPGALKIDERQLLQLNRYASLIGGTLKNTGKFYFPRKDQSAYTLDLEAIPVIETEDGKKILLVSDDNLEEELLSSIKSYWKELKIQKISDSIRQGQLLAEQYENPIVSGKIETAVLDNQHIVKQMISYSSYDYIPEAEIPFSINGVSLSATFGRIIRRPDHLDVLINFGSVYGFALEEIGKKEFEIVLIKSSESVFDIAKKIFSLLGFSIWENPTFKSSNGGVSTIPGLYFFKAGKKLFLTLEELNIDALDHLSRENVKIMKIN